MYLGRVTEMCDIAGGGHVYLGQVTEMCDIAGGSHMYLGRVTEMCADCRWWTRVPGPGERHGQPLHSGDPLPAGRHPRLRHQEQGARLAALAG